MSGPTFEPSDEVKTAQCVTVMAALREGPKTTSELHALGVLAPAARVMELRRSGAQIETVRRVRQGCYVLREGDR